MQRNKGQLVNSVFAGEALMIVEMLAYNSLIVLMWHAKLIKKGAFAWCWSCLNDCRLRMDRHSVKPELLHWNPLSAAATSASSALKGGRAGHLPGVGPVPEDSVAVGHHLGSRVLAVHTHPNYEDEEDEHFHLRHVCSGAQVLSGSKTEEGGETMW